MEVTAVMVRENGRWVIRINVPVWVLEDLTHEAETDTALIQIAATNYPYGVSFHWPNGGNTFPTAIMHALQAAVKLETVWDKDKP